MPTDMVACLEGTDDVCLAGIITQFTSEGSAEAFYIGSWLQGGELVRTMLLRCHPLSEDTLIELQRLSDTYSQAITSSPSSELPDMREFEWALNEWMTDRREAWQPLDYGLGSNAAQALSGLVDDRSAATIMEQIQIALVEGSCGSQDRARLARERLYDEYNAVQSSMPAIAHLPILGNLLQAQEIAGDAQGKAMTLDQLQAVIPQLPEASPELIREVLSLEELYGLDLETIAARWNDSRFSAVLALLALENRVPDNEDAR